MATITLTSGNDSYTDTNSGNTIIGLAGNDIINGAGGDDIIYGDDLLSVIAGNDNLNGGAGNDLIFGGNGSDQLTGSDGFDTLDGGAGNDNFYDETYLAGSDAFASPDQTDTLRGGDGNDLYKIRTWTPSIEFSDQAPYNDVIIENTGANGGIDTVEIDTSFTLPNNVENLILDDGRGVENGTGNSLNNAITGSSDNNVLSGLAGNDTLNGGKGVDTLFGGLGNDSLDGGGGNDVMAGNEGNDTLISTTASILLSGSTPSGSDTMKGGIGDDTYYTDGNDTITENSGEGIDTVIANTPHATMTLGANIENLVLASNFFIGDSSMNGVGNNLSNTITGNNANNLIQGLDGNDTLNGAGGNDILKGGIGLDRYDGGSGDDFLSYDSADMGIGSSANQYAGGTGVDSLGLGVATGITLNLTTLADDRITGVEQIVLGSSAAGNALILAPSDVIAMSGTTHTLRIYGGANDSAFSQNQGWIFNGLQADGGSNYEVYKVGQATLLVDSDIGGIIS